MTAGRGRSSDWRLPVSGLVVPPMVWGMQYRFTSDAVLVVFAELPYDPSDYIRDYEEFLELAAGE